MIRINPKNMIRVIVRVVSGFENIDLYIKTFLAFIDTAIFP